MHKTHHRHFLTYTLEHLIGAAFIIALSVGVGYVAEAESTGTSTTGSSTLNIVLDTVPPSTPLLHIVSVNTGIVALSWEGVTDNVGVQGYQLYKNGAIIASLTSTSYTDTSNLASGSVVAYFVKAYDASGNGSLPSVTTTVFIPTTTTGTGVSSNTSTSTTTSSTTPPPTATPSTATTPGVSFGATVAPITDCTTGKPLTEVFLVISDPAGGKFQISSDNGISNAPMEWGRASFANGHYYWKAIPAAGYTVVGDSVGTFTLSGECIAPANTPSTTNTTTATSGAATVIGTNGVITDTIPLKYPEQLSVVPAISIDNVRITEGDMVSGNVAFGVVAPSMTRAIFVIEGTKIGKQFIDKKLGVVHKDGTNEWTVAWNTASIPNGDYILAALMDNSAGTTLISKRVKFVVRNQPTSIVTPGGPGVVTTSAQVMPVIKVFVDNRPVSQDAFTFSDETVELRIAAANAKKVTLYASVSGKSAPLELGKAVIDDLLSGKSVDVWTLSMNAIKMEQNSYKLFTRVLYLDGTIVESLPMLVKVDHTPAVLRSSGNENDASTSPDSVMTLAQKEEILARVTSPALCTNTLECKVYCKSVTDNAAACKAFAQEMKNEAITVTSLADGISKERIENMLTDPTKRLKYLPEAVVHAQDMIDYCADPSHADICSKALEQNDLASLDTLKEKKQQLIVSRDAEKALLTERTGARAFIDSDRDGITDYDEVHISHTNPDISDTDKDGIPDGEELLARTNPNGRDARADSALAERTGSTTGADVPSRPASEGITLEDPLIAGVTQKELLSVNDVVAEELGYDDHGTSTVKKLKFTGSALPNSYVTLYIFSNPIVVTVRANASGEWTYTLDKELPNGSHQVVSAITSEGGHILAKSEPLPFVKEAAAVSVGANALLPDQMTPGFFTGASLYAFIAILIGLLGIAFSIIGFVVHQRSPGGSDVLFPDAKDK